MDKTIVDADIAAPFDEYRDVVRPEWIDNNGHMNMGYYLVVFDFATDAFFPWVGLDRAQPRAPRRDHVLPRSARHLPA
jgi:acyl-CoA thioesterase FadM